MADAGVAEYGDDYKADEVEEQQEDARKQRRVKGRGGRDASDVLSFFSQWSPGV